MTILKMIRYVHLRFFIGCLVFHAGSQLLQESEPNKILFVQNLPEAAPPAAITAALKQAIESCFLFPFDMVMLFATIHLF